MKKDLYKNLGDHSYYEMGGTGLTLSNDAQGDVA